MTENIYRQKLKDILKSNYVLPDTCPASYLDYDEPHDGEIDADNRNLKELSERSNFLNDLFDTLTASPAHKERFGSYYCFLKEAMNKKVQDKSAANYDDNSAQKCITDLIESAKDGTVAHYLTGVKGAGKTFFINYLVSYYRDLFIENRVIYIRTSLLKRSDEETITDRVARQSIKILVDYYFEPSILNITEFDSYLRTAAPEKFSNGEFSSELKKFIEDLDYRSAPIWIFKYLHKFIMEMDYSFLFIIDGLDAVEPTTKEEERFTEWFIEVMQFAEGELPFTGAWLFVAREESYRKHFPKKKSLAAMRSLGQFRGKTYTVKPTCLFVALKKRAEYQSCVFTTKENDSLLLGIKNIHSIVAKMIAKAFALDNLHFMQQEKLGFIPKHKDKSQSADHEVYERLSDIFAGDMRKAFYACHIALLASLSMQISIKGLAIEHLSTRDIAEALQSLEELFNGKSHELSFEESIYLSQVYRLVHPFVCGLNLYCVPPFEYSYMNKSLANTLTDGYDIESGTMPNLFQMNMDIIYEHSDDNSHKIVMAKFAKIIVLIYFYKFSYNESGVNFRKKKHLIYTSFKVLFDKPVLDVVLKELIYFNAIEEGRGASKAYSLTPGGEFYVEHFLWNSDYLACVMNTIAVPSFLFTSEKYTTLKYLSESEVLLKLNSTVNDKKTLTLNCKRHFNRILFATYLEWSWNDCLKSFEHARDIENLDSALVHVTDGLYSLKVDAVTKASRLISSHPSLIQSVSNSDMPRSLVSGLDAYKHLITKRFDEA